MAFLIKNERVLQLAVILLVFLFCADKFSATNQNKIVNSLILNGYENIKLVKTDNKIYLAYENRVYRFEINGIKELLNIVVPLIDDEEKLILIPLNRKIPIVEILADLNFCRDYLAGKISAKDFSNKLLIEFNTDNAESKIEKSEEFNSSNFRFDLVLKPLIRFEFGPYSDPVLGQINLAPDIRTGFWKGMKLSYEEIIPLWNEFGKREDSVRTGIVTLNQTLRFANSFFVSSTAGLFSNNRYGFDLELKKYLINGDLGIGGNLGVTSYLAFSGTNRIFYSDQFKWTGSLSIDYRIEMYDLTLGLSAGKFLQNDNSIRFDINREFGEIDIGFFAIHSTSGISNGGVTINIPLFPSKYWNPSVVRLRVAENYAWSYLVKSNTDQLIGLRYNTGNRINNFLKKLNPSFIKNSFN